jgi:hypothetical protein
MQVALVANTAWMDEELAMFRHVVIGLIDEQIRTVQVLPQVIDEDDAVAFGERLSWADSSWSLIRRRRLAGLADALEEMGVDVVHALDGRLWKGAYDLAEKIGCAAVFQSGSQMDLGQLPWLRRRLDSSRMALAPLTEPLAQTMHEMLGPQVLIETIPAAAHAGRDLEDQRDTQLRRDVGEGGICAVISGNAQCDDDYQALFEALTRLLEEFPQIQCFVDNMGLAQHDLWQAVHRYGILGNLSFVPRRLGHRELLLRADVLIQPQALGRSRGLTLHAMASGMPVIARADPWLDYLIDDETAWVIDKTDPEHWIARVRKLMRNPQSALDLGHRARQWIQNNRPVSRQVDQYRLLYHRVTGEGFKLQGQGE